MREKTKLRLCVSARKKSEKKREKRKLRLCGSARQKKSEKNKDN